MTERINRAKINRMVNMIRRLTVSELTELNKQLRARGLPPLETAGVGAKPKGNPPFLSTGATAGRDVRQVKDK